MEFRELWALIHKYVKKYLNVCQKPECEAVNKAVFHMWTNKTQVHIRLLCEQDHYEWIQVDIPELYNLVPTEEGVGLRATT